MAKQTIRQNDIHHTINRFISFLISFIMIILFSGCSEISNELDPDLATQVALDCAGLNENSVSNLETEKSDPGFQVKFTDEFGNYVIGVDTAGKISSYKYTMISEEQNSGNNTREISEVPSETNNGDSENNPVNNETIANKLSKEELIKRMADFLGISQYDESDFIVESSDDEKTMITVQLTDGRILFAEMNRETGEILRTGNR